MQCEICGKETAKPNRIILDGSHLLACKSCADYGVKEPERTPFSKPHAQRKESILEISDGIAQGYGTTIRHAREKKALTIEELGKKVFEKASFLHRIEAEAVKPSPALAKKLEDALGIKITEN